MELFGITGGIGMGKSAAGEILRRLGIPVVDSDQLARDVVAPGTPGLLEVLRVFGPEFQDASGALCRAALGRRVFANPADLAQLNALLHPRIRAAWQAQVTAWQAAGVPRAAVIIPLLFENAYETEFHTLICIACTPATQGVRLRARGWDEAEIHRRTTAQLAVPEKMRRAHRVIWTEGSLAAHAAQWELVLGLRPSLFNPAHDI